MGFLESLLNRSLLNRRPSSRRPSPIRETTSRLSLVPGVVNTGLVFGEAKLTFGDVRGELVILLDGVSRLNCRDDRGEVKFSRPDLPEDLSLKRSVFIPLEREDLTEGCDRKLSVLDDVRGELVMLLDGVSRLNCRDDRGEVKLSRPLLPDDLSLMRIPLEREDPTDNCR